jgi:myo-inositol-1(or 4)-monophosphatase
MDRFRCLIEGCTQAGHLLKERFGRAAVTHKGELDLVTEADLAAEKLLTDAILRHFPDDAIQAEEGGARPGSSNYQWVIDPLDGTTNYAQGLPHFAVSVALLCEGRLQAGAIYDPMRDELFHAQASCGAWLGQRRLQIATWPSLAQSLVVTGFPYNRRQRLPELLARVEGVLSHAIGLRRLGAASLDLAYVAAGRIALFYEDSLQPWDLAAGVLLVREAGGVTCDFQGNELDLESGEVVAGPAHLVAELREKVLQAFRPT